MVDIKTYGNACNKNRQFHINFCFLHARMPIKTETNFLIGEFYMNSVTKTIKPIPWFCMSRRLERIRRFPAQVFHGPIMIIRSLRMKWHRDYSLLRFLVLWTREQNNPVFGGGPISIGAWFLCVIFI